MNPFVRDIFATRAAIIRHIRRFFDDRGFLEVRGTPPKTSSLPRADLKALGRWQRTMGLRGALCSQNVVI